MALTVVTLLLIACLAVWMMFSRDLGQARERIEGRGQILATGPGTMEYATVAGDSPILVIHGSGGGLDQGLMLAEPLADRGYQLIAPSRFGYLGSPPQEGLSTGRQADAYVDLLDYLGIDQVVVLGASAGTLSAMQFAIRHADRCDALVLLVPASYAPDRASGESAAEGSAMVWVVQTVLRSDFLFWVALRFAPDAVTRYVLATEPALVDAAAQAEQERVAEMARTILPISRRAEGIMFDSATAGAPDPLPLAEISCPTLVISAEDDLYGTAAAARHIAANVPDAELVIYQDGGHVLVGRQRQTWERVDRFIEQHTR
ncbi:MULTISPECIES: alpha/beta hydrolase [unclassified Roseitalea]|uniref:alpha/beta fold hydrolase n=1 Tax=unclassified Roseitalea TaxID=2639107 RepID=UPI00273E1D2E|nr:MULTISPECIES: alpha/beta hydrolase [unclassified Roseitalea]